MSTEDKLSTIRAINEEKHRVQQYLEAIAKHKMLNHTSITLHTELESQTFIVTPQYVKLILGEMDQFFQIRNVELLRKGEELVGTREPETRAEVQARLTEIHKEKTSMLDQHGMFGGGQEVNEQFKALNEEEDKLNKLLEGLV